MQVAVLQCAIARYLRELVSSDAVTFPIAQQPGLQAGATPTLLLMKDMLFQARHLSALSTCYIRYQKNLISHKVMPRARASCAGIREPL